MSLIRSVEKTFAMIKPDAVEYEDEIRDVIRQAGFTIVCEKRVELSRERASDFYAEHVGRSFFERLLEFMTSGPVRVMVLAKENAVRAWRDLIGPTDAHVAREEAPDSIRSLYGTDKTRNAVHGSDSIASARREIKFFFPSVSVPILDSKEAIEYIDERLGPILRMGLTALCKEKPADPKRWLSEWLLSHNPNKPRDDSQEISPRRT